MSIDPNTLPDGTVAETGNGFLCFKDGEGYQTFRKHLGDMPPWPWRARTIARAYVPVPDGMTVDDAKSALADAGAWVEVVSLDDLPIGARVRREWRLWEGGGRYFVHRDDLPPTDPDAEAVEKMAEAMREDVRIGSLGQWDDLSNNVRDVWRRYARAALVALREHEATR